MSTAFQRGIVLFNQNRYDLADREFRQELAESPDNALAHAFLALCLIAARSERRSAARGRRSDPARSRRGILPLRAGASALRPGPAQGGGGRRPGSDSARPRRRRLSRLAGQHRMGRRRWAAALAAADRGLATRSRAHYCTNLAPWHWSSSAARQRPQQTLGLGAGQRSRKRADARQPGLGPAPSWRPPAGTRAFPRGAADRSRARLGSGRHRRGAQGPAPDLPADAPFFSLDGAADQSGPVGRHPRLSSSAARSWPALPSANPALAPFLIPVLV